MAKHVAVEDVNSKFPVTCEVCGEYMTDPCHLKREDYIRLAEELHAIDFDSAWAIRDGQVIEGDVFTPSVEWVTAEDSVTGEAALDIESSEWEPISANMTGQYGYNGPVLHSSETFSRGMAERFTELLDPEDGDYDWAVTTVVEVYETNEDGELEPASEAAGWIVLGHKRVTA